MSERAFSTVVNYALMLVVVGLLVAGLIVGVNGHVTDTQEQVSRGELSVVGNHLASDLQSADRLADGVDDGTVRIRTDLVEQIAGETYLVDVDSAAGTNRYALTLTTERPDVSVTVRLRTEHPLETGRYHGGPLLVVYDGTSLEVTHA